MTHDRKVGRPTSSITRACCVRWFGILFVILLFGGVGNGDGTPPTSNVAISGLVTRHYAANNWLGFTTPATSIGVAGDGLKYIQSQSNVMGQVLVTGTAFWRDEEVTSYTSRGIFFIRLSNGNGLFFSVNIAAVNGVRIGIVTGFDPTNPEGSGTRYNTYVQDNASGCITNWPTSGSHTFTFGAQGFDVYLKIDGVLAVDMCQTSTLNPTGTISYSEYRPEGMNAGQVAIWAHPGSNGARDITAAYVPLAFLHSNYVSGVFDPRDFGMRNIERVSGSIAAASTTVDLNGAADIRVGDRVIVEVGGEAGAGGYNTVGVGGTSPVLHYATATVRDADQSEPDQTYAYLDTDGSVWVYNARSTRWSAANLGGNYYVGVKAPFALMARVIAVNANPATQITLDSAASVATSNANVYLDVKYSFYPMTTMPAAYFQDGRGDGLGPYRNMAISIPAGTWYTSGKAAAYSDSNGARSGLTVNGQGQGVTILKSPKGAPSELFDGSTANSNVTFRDFTYIGNHGDNGYMFSVSGTNRNFSSYPGALVGGTHASNMLAKNITCVNDWNGCASFAGINPQISNISVNMESAQHAYLGWQVQLFDCTGGSISNSTVTSAFLIRAFELFACNGASIVNTTGTNALYATNSSTNWTIDTFTDTITANSYFSQSSGAIDEAIININNNAFHTGNTGIIKGNWSILQQGYIDAHNNTLKFIQIAPQQTNVTIQGGFPGAGDCTTSLGGYMYGPNYNFRSAEYGAMAVYSDAANTLVSGVRVVGTAIKRPGHSGHWGNISLLGPNSQVNNSVADAIQPGPTISGNQNNLAFCPGG
jgi:hypothetical protein